VILLASGDSFIVKQEAGNGNIWSYTATADLVITCYSADGFNLNLGTWVNSTSGNGQYIQNSTTAQQNNTNLNKIVLKSGESVTANNSGVNVVGVYIGGFEL